MGLCNANNYNKYKVKCIIRTYLLLRGSATAKELKEFINNNKFKLGRDVVSSSHIYRLVREDHTQNGMLKDVEYVQGDNKLYTYRIVKQ